MIQKGSILVVIRLPLVVRLVTPRGHPSSQVNNKLASRCAVRGCGCGCHAGACSPRHPSRETRHKPPKVRGSYRRTQSIIRLEERHKPP
eukprot:1195200-Prorocentrum_minimum.AAC.5